MDHRTLTFYLIFLTSSLYHCFSFLAPRDNGAISIAMASSSAAPSASASASIAAPTWSPSQRVDVTGNHAYQDPLPGQARGPCPAQNALANHGYLDRSGFTTYLDCVEQNVYVWNLGPDVAAFLCFQGTFTGGSDLSVTPWSIGNSSAVQSTINNACPMTGLLGLLNPTACEVSSILGPDLGIGGFGMAQTHNSFEGDSSFLQNDWATANGLDASTINMSFFDQFWTQRLPDGTFDNFQIVIEWASSRNKHSIATNPCYLRTPVATIFAALGAYTFIPALYANSTPEYPNGTLTGSTFATFFGVELDSNNNPVFKGFGKERIPDYWYHRPTPFLVTDFLERLGAIFANDPTLMDVGGNTNGISTFTGLDFGNLTGGVINGENLLQGDNFACFYYRLLQIDLENKLASPAGAALISLGPTLGAVADAIGGLLVKGPGGVEACPTFDYTGLNNYTTYCGVRQQPGGVQ